MPFHRTTDPETNPEPLTVSVKAAPPAVALDGESEVIDGAGLFTVKAFGNVAVPPPGAAFVTLTSRKPVAASDAIVMLAVT